METKKRQDWGVYFMDIAKQVATRGTCDRKHVGCVLVVDKNIVATGYNGSIIKQPHCDDVGHEMEEGHCVRTIHAEMNAVAQAAKRGAAIDGGTCYTTASPCYPCLKVLANAGITKIVFGELYRDARVFDVCKAAGIELVDLSAK